MLTYPNVNGNLMIGFGDTEVGMMVVFYFENWPGCTVEKRMIRRKIK
jgi:hypothetical protein